MTGKTPLLALACAACIAFGAQAEESETPLFDALSLGNQRIAQALFESQGESDTGLTLDQIAQFKADGLGWGQVFSHLRTEGAVPEGARNLGQVVSGHYQPPAIDIATAEVTAGGGRSSRPVVVTTGAGGRIVLGANGAGLGQAGANGIGHGNGNALGHTKAGAVSASGIVNAAGGAGHGNGNAFGRGNGNGHGWGGSKGPKAP